MEAIETSSTEQKPKKRRSYLTLIKALSFIGGILLTCCTVLGFFANQWWRFDVLSHFRMQYLIALIIIGLLFLLTRGFVTGLFFILIAAVNAWFVAPYYSTPIEQRAISGPSLRVLVSNVYQRNERYELVKSHLVETNPDIAVFSEVNEAWLRELLVLRKLFPYHEAVPQENAYGMAIFSKHPLLETKIHYIGDVRHPVIETQILVKGTPVTIVGIHVTSPKGESDTNRRNHQLASIPKLVRDIQGPLVVCGDFNITPWSPFFDRLTQQTRLFDTSVGRGVLPTWPTNNPLLRIPIDHCLVSSNVTVLNKQVGSNVGSDHFPVVLDISVPSATTQ